MSELQVTNSMSQAEMEAYWRGAERERIIALLEAEHSEFTEQHQNDPVYLDDCSACFAIALIKGDNK